mgnify:CR=1 FL=1
MLRYQFHLDKARDERLQVSIRDCLLPHHQLMMLLLHHVAPVYLVPLHSRHLHMQHRHTSTQRLEMVVMAALDPSKNAEQAVRKVLAERAGVEVGEDENGEQPPVDLQYTPSSDDRRRAAEGAKTEEGSEPDNSDDDAAPFFSTPGTLTTPSVGFEAAESDDVSGITTPQAETGADQHPMAGSASVAAKSSPAVMSPGAAAGARADVGGDAASASSSLVASRRRLRQTSPRKATNQTTAVSVARTPPPASSSSSSSHRTRRLLQSVASSQQSWLSSGNPRDVRAAASVPRLAVEQEDEQEPLHQSLPRAVSDLPTTLSTLLMSHWFVGVPCMSVCVCACASSGLMLFNACTVAACARCTVTAVPRHRRCPLSLGCTGHTRPTAPLLMSEM